MKKTVWAFLVVVAVSSTSWGAILTASSAGGIGMVGGQTVGRVLLPGAAGADIGVHIGVQHTVINAGGAVISGSNALCGGNPSSCGGGNQQPPVYYPGCWPSWPYWCWPWGGVATSSTSTSTATASGPGTSATAETSGVSIAPGSSSSSHSYAHSVNP
ncbi:hypothetical protein [Anaerobaca lacustris]|uniref:DUF320 domain-containing protein n=1 Tax=Anaerobaca lacustris TaxID=3044600 RepID=A0AAW6U0D4_9BACT|nr:hypothetical protein [Sedimentisphaerales bacterium M17dextr]